MSPIILTTGNKEKPLAIDTLPKSGNISFEDEELRRGRIAQIITAADVYLSLGRIDEARLVLLKSGMSEEIADDLVAAASKNRPGLEIRFNVALLESEDRKYINFIKFRRK